MNNLETGIKHFTDGNIEEAEIFLTKAITDDPKNTEAWFYRGKVNRMKGDFIAALNDFHKTVDIEPNHCEAKVSIELLNNILSFRNPDLINH
jgi:Tfp pilus assembly protein PilF